MNPTSTPLSEDTKQKIAAAIKAKTTGLIGIGFSVRHSGVHVVRGVLDQADAEERAFARLNFNTGYGDLHINGEGISETLKFLGDGAGPDALIRCFVPWEAVFVVSEESIRVLRYAAPAPEFVPAAELATTTAVADYNPTPPRTGHLRLVKGDLQ